VPVATQQDVDDAVAAGRRAFTTWSQTPIGERKALMNKFVDLWTAHEAQFVDLLCAEVGKPRAGAASEISSVRGMFAHHTALSLPEERMEDDDRVVTTRYVPLGVVGAICPWNFPVTLSAGKLAPALLTGCTIIIKPSPFTPYTALKMAELAQQVFPPGVVQALAGGDDLGPMIVAHPGVAKISFTGSIATGKRIMAACAATLKRVTLELGGNDPCIVFPDVDVDACVPEVTIGSFWNTAQVCVATKRVYVHESIYREFVDKMAAFARTLKVGASDEPGVRLGPLQNEMQYEKVKAFFADSAEKGHTFVLGEAVVPPSKGFFIQPAIIDNPPSDSRIVQEEPFGPILPVQPWSDLDEVVARANNTRAGLAASVWSKDVAKAEAVARRIEAGSVFVNSWTKPGPRAFFGGVKESGLGGEWGTTGKCAGFRGEADGARHL
jgi:acyl-CoA reductase-like NAD-dependent aldehyde dehydrogenase